MSSFKIPRNIDTLTIDLSEHDMMEVRSEAIDEFVEKISLEISESLIWGMLVNSHKDNNFSDTSDKIVGYVIDTVKEIAEQMKGGGKNE